ncbi:MAG: hypothetical protein GDA36_04125 [Rhodobacteraceae bacterium]|nr:hypothetical protein [Paracoccaceae bacterium]
MRGFLRGSCRTRFGSAQTTDRRRSDALAVVSPTRKTGSAHDDTLTGDAGGDVFVFAGFDGDSITDFQDGTDRIDLHGTTVAR